MIGKSKIDRFSRIILGIFLFVSLTASANALEIGYCDTPEGLSTKLADEGHRTFATMDRVGISLTMASDDKTAYAANLITAKPDLSSWYMIRGDRPLAERSTRMCISAAGRNLEVNDYRLDRPPTVTTYQFDADKALLECNEVAKNFYRGEEDGIGCNSYNEVITRFKSNLNHRIALQGISLQNTLMTIVTDPQNTRFRMLATAQAGATGISLRGDKFTFSNWVLEILDRKS